MTEDVVKLGMLDEGAENRLWREDSENFHFFTNCNANTCGGSLFKLFELAGIPKSPAEVPLEDRDRVV